MTTTEPKTALECAFALAEATGLHSHLLDSPLIVARYNAMTVHKEGVETACEAALRIIAQDHRRQARIHAETSAMCARLQLKLTAALEQVAAEHRERIRSI